MKDASATLNIIRATATSAYQDTVPLATFDNIDDVGVAVLTAPTSIQNEFYDALQNIIGKQLISSVEFSNPLTGLKKGRMEYGQTIEDIYVGMISSTPYVAGTRVDPTDPPNLEAYPDPFEVFKGNVKSGFYSTQLERQYPITISHQDLQRAFASANGVDELIAAKYNALRSSIEYDDYRMTVALMARQIESGATDVGTGWNGLIPVLSNFNTLYTKTLTAATCLSDVDFLKYLSAQIQKWSTRMQYVRSDLNIAGAESATPRDRQSLVMLSDIQSDLNAYLTAWAYNKGDLALGNVIGIDAWYSIGADDTASPVVTPDDIEIKAELGLAIDHGTVQDPDVVVYPVIGMLYDPDMIKIYNKVNITDSIRNARGHYTNVFNTVGDIYAASPFRNFVAFALA